VQGFLRSAGLTSLEQCEKRDTGKGEFWFAVIEKQGRATAEVLQELLPTALAALPWPKSMRWADHSLRWVRPLHSILCLFEGQVVPFSFGHLKAGDSTHGHRFMAPKRLVVRDAADWLRSLRGAYVEPDFNARRELILKDAAFAAGNEKCRSRSRGTGRTSSPPGTGRPAASCPGGRGRSRISSSSCRRRSRTSRATARPRGSWAAAAT
jgi:glycyl-tRNA synthetase beta chain